MRPFVWQVRVYWEDTDAGGVVYHSRYLNFFERARTEWLRQMGVHQSQLAGEHGIVFAIVKMNIEWLKAARLDDGLDVSVESVRVGGVRTTFRQVMSRHADGEPVARAEVTAASLDAATFQPVRMPARIRAEIKKNAE